MKPGADCSRQSCQGRLSLLIFTSMGVPGSREPPLASFSTACGSFPTHGNRVRHQKSLLCPPRPRPCPGLVLRSNRSFDAMHHSSIQNHLAHAPLPFVTWALSKITHRLTPPLPFLPSQTIHFPSAMPREAISRPQVLHHFQATSRASHPHPRCVQPGEAIDLDPHIEGRLQSAWASTS